MHILFKAEINSTFRVLKSDINKYSNLHSQWTNYISKLYEDAEKALAWK